MGDLALTDRITKEQRSKIMSAIRSKDTKPELAIRKELFRLKLRYRLYYGVEKIDIAFPGCKVAVFVDGCFWHGCPLHANVPKTNQEYWLPKLKRNIKRDNEKTQRLEGKGWLVFHFWEHETVNALTVASSIQKEILARNMKTN
jgi:DNA mismatch endonuclease (patch repair protein)